MQLKKSKPIRSALTSATCTLLGTQVHDAVAFGTDTPWESDNAILYYSEYQRVTAIEPVFNARKELDSNEFLNLRLVVDVLTGASATGAVPMPFAQTFTTPSGESTYTIGANDTPLDPSFKDIRAALSAAWEKSMTRTLRAVYGGYLSREYDYTSLGGSAAFSRDTEDKNRTLTASIAFSYDLVSPIGGTPVELSAMPASGPKQTSGKDDTKTVVDFLIGVTQILDRQSLLQLNYNIVSRSGYLTDPYKILSVVDDNTGLLVNTNPYRFEARPNDRVSQSVYAKYVHQFTEDVIYLTYRYF